jgi:hypothetical protein
MVRDTKFKPKVFQVLGERSSGTNYVNQLLKQTLDADSVEELGWKHGFPHMRTVPDRMLVVCVFRNAVDWALSMHRKPWHTTKEMQRLSLADFTTAPWDTIVDKPHQFNLDKNTREVDRVLQFDRHPITGEMMPDIWELRNLKTAAFLGFRNRSKMLVNVQLETVLADPEHFVRAIRKKFAIGGADNFDLGERRFGSGFRSGVKVRPETPDEMPEAVFSAMCDRLDSDQEAAIGYKYTQASVSLLYAPGL